MSSRWRTSVRPSPRSKRAVSAIVTGDAVTLKRVLRDHPKVTRARSTREHGGTLLHYVSANGVEGFRQVSPGNAAEIAEILLAAGADVDAEADVYEGRCTPLGLVATSGPPFIAGVQQGVIDVLLNHGARMDLPGSVGRRDGLVRGCLANGQPQAAEYLASRGAPLDLAEAAGLGRLDVVKGFFDADGHFNPKPTQAQMVEGFGLACAYGRAGCRRFPAGPGDRGRHRTERPRRGTYRPACGRVSWTRSTSSRRYCDTARALTRSTRRGARRPWCGR